MVSSGGGGRGGTCPSQETRWLCVATFQKGARRRSCTLRIWRLLPILHMRRVMNGGVLVIRDRPRCHFAAAERTRKITVASPGRPLLADDSGVLLFLMLMFLMLLSSTCNKHLAKFFFFYSHDNFLSRLSQERALFFTIIVICCVTFPAFLITACISPFKHLSTWGTTMDWKKKSNLQTWHLNFAPGGSDLCVLIFAA